MKTVLVHIEGSIKPGDYLIVSHSHPQRGGRSNARYDAPEPHDTIQIVDGKKVIVTVGEPTISDGINRLVQEANKWDGFKARQRNGNEFVVQCSDAVDLVHFTGEGSGDQTITIEELT